MTHPSRPRPRDRDDRRARDAHVPWQSAFHEQGDGVGEPLAGTPASTMALSQADGAA